MTIRRMKSISPPTFSLGIRPVASKPAVETDTAAIKETPMIVKTAALETETPKNPKRTRNQVAEETKEEEEPAGKRTKKPSRYLVSPYINKKTVINTPLKPDEMMVTNALFSMQGNPYEFVFQTEWAWGAATIRDNMQTLAPKLKTTAIVNAKKEDEEKQYKEFCANMKSVFKGNPEDSSMDHVELAFFPIIAHEHFYLIVFNLEKGTSVILDNSNSGATYESKYSKEIDILKKLFSRYLASHKHKKASDIGTKKITLMKLKWGTKQNVIDCGVFVMMHMEEYGGEALKNWKFDFPKEGQDQQLEIIRMRIKYTTKMLMHELNIHREKINQETFEFASKNTDKALMQSMIREEIDKKKEDQDRDHVASAK
ncbi:ulp1 protease family, C-terminal catalytic domain-containing protein [Artemisia annua]|uniref:Ulp1 protease family, C-terminal catalytic domain-containing protein n=1 Tax=Artemisia annua TaxID=35608 RepID=A0A2U1LZT7_ARTAN|nr:ulp1 protease family, C-terminal catalytic domain-containing protein [Artemisia annua]